MMAPPFPFLITPHISPKTIGLPSNDKPTIYNAVALGAISFDAVKHLVLCRLEGRPSRLDLELYPYLPRVRVSTTCAGDYMSLLSGRAA